MAESKERIYTIPLRREWLKARKNYRACRSVSAVKAFLSRHMKSDSVMISESLNQFLWKRGVHKPPSRIRVKASLDDEGRIRAMLPEEKMETDKKESKPPEKTEKEKPEQTVREKEQKPEATKKESPDEKAASETKKEAENIGQELKKSASDTKKPEPKPNAEKTKKKE